MFCDQAKECLSQKGLEFQERDIAQDPSALADLKKLGYMTTPVIVVDDWVIVGFDAAKIAQALQGLPVVQNMLFNRAPLWDRTCTDLNSLCYNSITEHGQMLGVAMACGRFLAVFHTVHLLSIWYRKLVIFGGID